MRIAPVFAMSPIILSPAFPAHWMMTFFHLSDSLVSFRYASRTDEGSTYEEWMNEIAADVQDELPLPPVGHPLHELGKHLAQYLDDDRFNECERLLLEGWDHDKIDRKTGQHWRENSSLEVWFPFSAEELERLRETLQGIADADWRNWKELADPNEFVRWAQARARHALTPNYK
jgi:hypothetical protein